MYYPVLPGAVDDTATPAQSPKTLGLDAGSALTAEDFAFEIFRACVSGELSSAGDIEAPREHAPVRNVVLTIEQKDLQPTTSACFLEFCT